MCPSERYPAQTKHIRGSTFGATDAILGGNVVIAFVGATAVAIAAADRSFARGSALRVARKAKVYSDPFLPISCHLLSYPVHGIEERARRLG